MFANDFHEWTSCEVHGHVFESVVRDGVEVRHCTDCGHEYEP